MEAAEQSMEEMNWFYFLAWRNSMIGSTEEQLSTSSTSTTLITIIFDHLLYLHWWAGTSSATLRAVLMRPGRKGWVFQGITRIETYFKISSILLLAGIFLFLPNPRVYTPQLSLPLFVGWRPSYLIILCYCCLVPATSSPTFSTFGCTLVGHCRVVIFDVWCSLSFTNILNIFVQPDSK